MKFSNPKLIILSINIPNLMSDDPPGKAVGLYDCELPASMPCLTPPSPHVIVTRSWRLAWELVTDRWRMTTDDCA